jgi:pimeloyl-ACP methyl ester carboxylesterase
MQATIQGTTIHYETEGEGPPVVFVHGLGGTSSVWHAQRVVLSRYFKVVVYDLSGSGRSERGAREYSIDGWADELAGVLDAAGIERAAVVGHSMATLIVQRFALRYPERVSALALAGPLTELAPPGKEGVRKRGATVEAEGMGAVVDAILAGALTTRTREGSAGLAGLLREVLLSNDPICYAGHCRALAEGSVKGEQAQIRCPTLILVGDQDPVTPLANARQIGGEIAGAVIRVIPGTAHMTMLESPDAFNTALLEFLATV